ncbi:MAG: 30S ribosome-binding factor RbfA [Erysipelotrichaceae bacterium]|nr:30S ribosome-binding factor RbfA [Erysipelotrichaceae bacterium]
MGVRKAERIASIIKKAVSEYTALELDDPQVEFVTVTDVEVTNDLSFAKVYVTFMDQKGSSADRLEALERHKGQIRTHVASHLDTRKCPALIFKIDESLEKGNRIEEIIRQLNKND